MRGDGHSSLFGSYAPARETDKRVEWYLTDKDGTITGGFDSRVWESPSEPWYKFVTLNGETDFTKTNMPSTVTLPSGFMGDFDSQGRRFDGNRYFDKTLSRWQSEGPPTVYQDQPSRYASKYQEPGSWQTRATPREDLSLRTLDSWTRSVVSWDNVLGDRRMQAQAGFKSDISGYRR